MWEAKPGCRRPERGGAGTAAGRLRWVGRERERLRERLTIDGRPAAATTVVRASLPAPQRLGFLHEAMGTEAAVRATIGFEEPSVRAEMPARPFRTPDPECSRAR